MTPRVLLADDDPLLRELASEHLRQEGFAVTAVVDGQQALKALSVQSFDLIVTDMVMPNVDGIELLLALRHRRVKTPVLAISAGMDSADADLLLRTARMIGAAGVMRKPLTRERFVAHVREALAHGRVDYGPASISAA